MTDTPILFFREEEEPDPWRTRFAGAGFAPHFIPVLDTSYHSPGSLHDALQASPPDVVVVTSRRSLVALGQDIRTVTSIVQEWGHVPWFAVGPATARAAVRLGLNVQPVLPGASSMLVEPILASNARRVYFLTGNPHRDELEQALDKQAIDLQTFILYSTTISEPEHLPADAGWAVVFSPRGVQAVRRSLSASPGLRRAAIGPTTAAALTDAGLTAHVVSDYPDPDSLFKSISSCP